MDICNYIELLLTNLDLYFTSKFLGKTAIHNYLFLHTVCIYFNGFCKAIVTTNNFMKH